MKESFESQSSSSGDRREEPMEGPEAIAIPARGAETMPAPEASDMEYAAYVAQQLLSAFEDPGDPRTPELSAEKYVKDTKFYLHLAKELLPKVKDEAAQKILEAAISRAETTH